MSERPDYEISAVTYNSGEIELTFENLRTRDKACLTITRDEDVGGELLKVIGPCVYYRARFKDLKAENAKLEAAVDDWKKEEELWREREAELLARIRGLTTALKKAKADSERLDGALKHNLIAENLVESSYNTDDLARFITNREELDEALEEPHERTTRGSDRLVKRLSGRR